MAAYQSARTRAHEQENMGSFVRRRDADRLSSADASAIWNAYERQAIREGIWPSAKTPAEVKARARELLRRKHEREAREGSERVFAFARGAADSLPFGMADAVSDRTNAFFSQRPGESWNDAVNREIAAEEALDRDDARRHAAVRTAGQVAGTAAQVLGLGAVEGMVLPGMRIAQTSPLIARDLAAMGGAGGITNTVGQAVSDAVTGHRSSWGDYAGAFAGGVAGGVAMRSGLGSLAGAVDGAATSIAQDLANEGKISLESLNKAATNAQGDAMMGGLMGGAARIGVDKLLSSKTKGAFGEYLSKVRSWARGERTGGEQEKFNLGGGGYTKTDHRTFSGGKPQAIVEAKMGRSIDDLSERQNQARDEINDGVLAVGRTILQELGEEFSVRRAEELGRRYIKQLGGFSEYRTDHWLPQDFGAAAGMIPSLLGFSTSRRDRQSTR